MAALRTSCTRIAGSITKNEKPGTLFSKNVFFSDCNRGVKKDFSTRSLCQQNNTRQKELFLESINTKKNNILIHSIASPLFGKFQV